MDYSNGLLMGDPSLTGLLGGVQPPMPGPQITPGALPQPVAAPAQPAALPQPTEIPNPRRSLLARVHDALISSVMSPIHTAHDALEGALVGKAPTGFDGVLTPDEIQQAKPGLLNAMFGGAPGETGQQQYEQNLEAAVKNKLTSAQAQQMQNVLKGRQALYQAIGMPKDGDPAADKDWVTKAIAGLTAIGDYEGVKALSPFAEKFYPRPVKPNEPLIFVDPQGNQHLVAPDAAQGDIPPGWKLVNKTGSTAGTVWVNPALPASDPKKYVHSLDAPGPGYQPVSTNNIQITQSGAQGRFDAGRDDKMLQQYQQRLQQAGITKAAPVLNQSLLTLAEARNNPDPNVRKVLYSSAIANFVQAADPKAQIRWQLLNYFKDNINASAADRVKLLLSRLRDGTLPDSVLEGMASHLQNIKGLMASEIRSQRSTFLKEHPDVDGSTLADETQFFPAEAPKTDTPAGDAAGRAAWAKANPPKPGESRDAYKARYEASKRGK